jgi:hypothetical protein
MSGIQIKIQGTEEQFKQMTLQCEMTEAMFANTLARRIEGMKAEESIEFILNWFQSVRHMAQAALMSSGIKTAVAPIGAEAANWAEAQKIVDQVNSGTYKPEDVVAPKGYSISESKAWSDGWWAGHKAAHDAKASTKPDFPPNQNAERV